jgi:hypothetical protein
MDHAVKLALNAFGDPPPDHQHPMTLPHGFGQVLGTVTFTRYGSGLPDAKRRRRLR